MVAPGAIEAFEWVKSIAAIVTPFAVLWLGIRAANRKKLMESIDAKLEDMRKSVRNGQEECREDVRAVAVQFGAFQREVASDYPKRHEIFEGLKEIRQEIRDLKIDRMTR